MTKIIRGKANTYSRLNTVSPTFLRKGGVFVGFLIDESLQKWDDIVIHADSESQIAAAISIFYIYCAATGDLLKVADGISDLKDSVGGFAEYTTESLSTFIQNQENGRLYHRFVDKSVYAFFIRLTPEGDTEESQEPAPDGVTRIEHLMSRVNEVFDSMKGLSKKSMAFNWLIYPRQGLGIRPPPPGTRAIANGVGPTALREKLAHLTQGGTTCSNFRKNWCKYPGVKIKRDLGLDMWDEENVDGFLYSSKANKWVRVVSTAEERTRLVNQGN